MGLVDTPKGLVFGKSANRSDTPSEILRAIIQAAESPTKFAYVMKMHSSCKDKAMAMRKFEHVASDSTRRVIINARKEPTPFVYPQDFACTSDVDFLLFHQVKPSRPSTERLKQRGLTTAQFHALSGLCCKHCASTSNDSEVGYRGVYYPAEFASLADSTFSQTLSNHVLSCRNVPQEIKNALNELKRLATENGITAKRGSKKNFVKKIWGRMENYYE